MKTVCHSPRSIICTHKRNVDKDLIACAIDADTTKCKFAQKPAAYLAELKSKLEA